MKSFVIPSIVAGRTAFAATHYPLPRAEMLEQALATLFSRYLGSARSGKRFEAEGLLVTGASGSGKTEELHQLITAFNESALAMPSGQPARIISVRLERKVAWKDLGRAVLIALGYPLADNARVTQVQIWRKAAFQALEQGVVAIWFDEAQHLFRGKSDSECLAILDSFKSLMKLVDWPLMLILSGVPELEADVRREPQLYRLLTTIRFEDIAPTADYQTVHEIVGSYAVDAGLDVDDDLLTFDFYDRLATAGAFRWGLVLQLTQNAMLGALARNAPTLEREDFATVWAKKTGIEPIAGPFHHPAYDTMFRKDRPFEIALSD